MKIFSIDESGYTGHDLLNKSQQWQGASAVSINHEEASNLIKKYFPRRQALELKFNTLKKREGNLKQLYALQKELLTNYPCVTIVADKRFMMLLMFIDLAVEPFYYEKGINLYKDGRNYAIASLAYEMGPKLFGNDFDNILRAFQNAVHEKTHKAVEILINSVLAVDWKRFAAVLGPLALKNKACIETIIHKKTLTDAAFIICGALISRTELMSNGPYGIEHDRSDNLLQYDSHFSRLIEYQTSKKFIGSIIASIQFPLKLQEIHQIDSKLSPSVQLADILIGSVMFNTYQMREQKKSPSPNFLSLYKENQFFHYLPRNFEENTKFMKNSQGAEMIDFFAKLFSSLDN